MATNRRADLAQKAQTAAQNKRYDDMAKLMAELATTVIEPITTHERQLLNFAYKNAIELRRQAIESFTESQQDRQTTAKSELRAYCEVILRIVEGQLKALPDHDKESKVFYLTMKGDYLRYKAEVVNEDRITQTVTEANTAYSKGFDIAKMVLVPNHVARLRLALQYSRFLYDVMYFPDKACRLATEALDEALKEVQQEVNAEVEEILDELQENIALWTSQEQEVYY